MDGCGSSDTVVCFIGSLGPVTEVKTDIYVTSFGPVSDVEMVRFYVVLHNFGPN